MVIYRISNRRYGPLDPIGAARTGGRWNSLGTPVVYAAAAFEGAILEQLVHAGGYRLPKNRMAWTIEVPDTVEVERLDVDQAPDWRDVAVSQQVGDDWVRSGQSAVLIVPSFVAQPWGRNVVLNPSHADFRQIKPLEDTRFQWDSRLWST